MIKLSPRQIESWVSRYFPDYKKKSGGRQLVINNPFDGDTGHHFWISLVESPLKRSPDKKGYWVHDFRPGRKEYSGSFLGLVRKYKNCSFYEALADVVGGSRQALRDQIRAARRTQEETKRDEPEEIESEVSLPPLSKPFSEDSGSRLRSLALGYLRGRRVSEQSAIGLMLHYTAGTIVFPYIEYGSIVYWQERDILNKRFNFPDEVKTGLGKTDFLYNFDNVEPGEYVVVVESIFNCISIGDNCVATGGAIMEGKQLRKLAVLNPKLVVLAPDSDHAGVLSLRANYLKLRKDFDVAYCLPPVKDWNDLEIRDGVGSAKKYLEDNTHKLSLPVIMRLLERQERIDRFKPPSDMS